MLSQTPNYVTRRAPLIEACCTPPLAIIVVNFRTTDLTLCCLESLSKEVGTVPGTRVVVVDNASGDGSADRLTAAILARGWNWAEVVRSEKNLGFAGGNNLGWRFCQDARMVLLLNSDTVVHQGCLAHCEELMRTDGSIGAMSCLLLNGDGSVQNVTRKMPTPYNQVVSALGLPWRCPKLFSNGDIEDLSWDRRSVRRDVEWVGGAFTMLRGELVRRIGLLDEDFFFYGEDIELCHRIRRHGFRVHYDPRVSITHFGGSSSDAKAERRCNLQRSFWRARYLVQRKCHGRGAELAVRAADIGSIVLRLAFIRFRLKRARQTLESGSEILRIIASRDLMK